MHPRGVSERRDGSQAALGGRREFCPRPLTEYASEDTDRPYRAARGSLADVTKVPVMARHRRCPETLSLTGGQRI